MATNLLARIPRETKAAAVVLGVALLQVFVLAAVGLGRTERQRDEAEQALTGRARRALTTLATLSVQQVTEQERALDEELAREDRPLTERVREALRRAPLFETAHALDAAGEPTPVRRLPDPVAETSIDLEARRRVDAVLARERADPAAAADAAVALADALEREGAGDLVAVALALQCGARAAFTAGDPNRALSIARRTLLGPYASLRDDRAAEGQREPFGPTAALVVCEALLTALPTGDDATQAAFVEAVAARRELAQRLRAVLSESGSRVEREDCLRLRRQATALRAGHQAELDRRLRECDAIDAELAAVRDAPRVRTPPSAPRRESARLPLADGSLLVVVPVRGAAPWAAVALTAPAARLRDDVLAGELERLGAPEGTRLLVRDATGEVAVGARPEGMPRTLCDTSLAPAFPGLVAEAVLVDPSVVDREADAARRDWLWVLGAAILAVLAASLLAVRAMLRETRLARMKSDFVSNLSHELRTPLTSVRMFVETLQEGRVRNEREARECLDVIRQETDRLASLVDRVLQFASFAKGRAPIDLRSGDLGEVAGRASDLFRKRAEALGARLEFRVEQDLPEAILDRDAIVQVILNLLDNAVKHAGHPGARIRVTVRRNPPGGGQGSAVVVEDDGPGIPERERTLVFEEFYRGDDTLSRRTQGAGLGLALSRRIALAHGGALEVSRSEDLGGAAFVLSLPDAAAGRRLAAAQHGGAR